MLHAIETAAKGGESLFADGFAVANQLRDSHPEYFRLAN